jgi:transcriptional regulator with XRE-family HTH domain
LPLPIPRVAASYFQARLIQIRRHANMTQQTLADTAKIHVNQICRYEAGTAQQTLEALVGLARALHASRFRLAVRGGQPYVR